MAARQPVGSPRAPSGRDESRTGALRRRSFFNRFAERAAHVTGRPATFAAALAIVVLWAILGPTFGFSDTWQLVINTSTTIVTFLMVFLIQNTQNRDARAVQIKLDELIRAIEGAQNALLDLEDPNDASSRRSARVMRTRPARARASARRGRHGVSDIELRGGAGNLRGPRHVTVRDSPATVVTVCTCSARPAFQRSSIAPAGTITVDASVLEQDRIDRNRVQENAAERASPGPDRGAAACARREFDTHLTRAPSSRRSLSKPRFFCLACERRRRRCLQRAH
jgi:low affinity Fe/Cu permease